LTKFVKDLLHLDSLDALIDGLHPVGNVSRLRGPAPQFYTARSDLPELERDAGMAEAEAKALETELLTLEGEIRALAGEVLPAERPIEPDLLVADLSSRRQVDDRDLTDLARRQREIEVIRSQVAAYATTAAGAQRTAA
jgi:exonuclease SbcC